jgi:surfeit locus 1 family protein
MAPRFRPRFWPTLGAGLLVVLFLLLAFWQARRAQVAASHIARLKRAERLPPRPWRTFRPRKIDWRRWRYRRVIIHGVYDGRKQILIEEMYNHGRNGYDVLTPFRRKDGSWVLVDRGWVPADRGGAKLRLAPPAGPTAVVGVLGRLPRPAVRLGPNPPQSGWPQKLLFPRRAGLERRLGRRLPAAVVLLGPHQPGGYVRLWVPRTRMGPWRHWGYAAQWLLLAVVVIVVWVALNVRRGKIHD